MKLIAFSVYDTATETFGRPFFVPHAGAATRSFLDELKNKDSALGQHPNDYELFDCGSFDDQTGTFSATQPVRVLRGADFDTTKG